MRTTVKLLVVIFLFLSAVFAGYFFTQSKQGTALSNGSLVSAQEVNRAESDGDAIIVDVRTPQEYDSGHLKNSLLLPLDEIAQKASSVIPDKGKKIYVYCRTGHRSAQAVGELQNMGYSDVHSMDGGIVAWQNSGFASCQKGQC